MKFVFVAKHRNIWPVAWLCNAMGVSRSGFHAWLNRTLSARSRSDEAVSLQVKASFLASDRTYGARRVWRDLLADGVECGLHRIERLMRLQALRARPRRRRLPKDEGDRQVATVASNLLDRQFVAERPNQKWIADFTYIWTAEGWLCGFRGLRPLIPIERDHAVRSKTATCSDEGGRGVVAGIWSGVRFSWLRQVWRAAQ